MGWMIELAISDEVPNVHFADMDAVSPDKPAVVDDTGQYQRWRSGHALEKQ